MKNLLLKLLGPLLAVAGVLGLTGSSILWNFQGRGFGLPATILSLITLAVGVVLLRPLSSGAPAETIEIADNDFNEIVVEATDESSSAAQTPRSANSADDLTSEKPESTDAVDVQKPSLTTAEAIAAELASADAARPEIAIVNFAPGALQPGNSLRQNKRAPGKNLTGFKDMASELFKTT